MIRRPPRSTLDRSSAASDVYKRQPVAAVRESDHHGLAKRAFLAKLEADLDKDFEGQTLSLIHISEPTRPY